MFSFCMRVEEDIYSTNLHYKSREKKSNIKIKKFFYNAFISYYIAI